MAPTVDSREIQTKEEKNMPSVRFKEVAVYFSEEEWSRLDAWQKERYSNVMRDIHTTLLSAGYTILHPDVLCRIRRDHEPYISSLEEDHKGLCFPSTSASVLTPDIIFRIKHDEDIFSDEADGQHGSIKAELGFPADALLNEEGKSGGIQKEEQKDIHSNEDLTSETSEASQLVFNPKFSIWIKQVDEVSEVTSEVLPAACTDENVTEIKTEMDFTPDSNKSLQELTETAPDRNTTLENYQIQEKNPKEEHAGKEEESLLSIVLRRANAGSLYIPNYKYSSSCKDVDYSHGVPGMVQKETRYPPKLSFFQSPNSNALLSSFCAHTAPLQHCTHPVDKPFRCRICNKCFKTLGILNVHMKTHSGVRPYQCSECGKSFRDNWNLKVHQKIHTGETPYRCTICDKGFIQYATYMKHQRIHTGEKPYSCCYCDKSFTNSSNLVRHYRTHTGEKPYVCMECGKSFSYNTSLIQHKRIHKVEPAENGSNKRPTGTGPPKLSA
ncbi:zinc finger protein 566-like isoform X2 [Eleutherodactylus coqui]|uniref:zinc finger protein 566-like isoform X2 n=1 Tax=Eleutherodactylus coqui TaxID=57060 RepID=UPI0034633630